MLSSALSKRAGYEKQKRKVQSGPSIRSAFPVQHVDATLNVSLILFCARISPVATRARNLRERLDVGCSHG